MSDREEFHDSHVGDEDSESEEVVFRTSPVTSPATQPELITRSDLQEIIEGWEEKFHKLTEDVRAFEQATEKVHAHMNIVMRDNRARESNQVSTNNRIKQIQEGLARLWKGVTPRIPHPYTPSRHHEHTYHAVGSPSKVPIGIPLCAPLLTKPRQQSPRAATEVMTSVNDLHTRG